MICVFLNTLHSLLAAVMYAGWAEDELQVRDSLSHCLSRHVQTPGARLMDRGVKPQPGNCFILGSRELGRGNCLCLPA